VLEIKPIAPHQAPEAKRLILSIAREMLAWPEPLDEIVRTFDERGEMRDLDELPAHYFERGGLFLAVLDDGRLIGTGAVRRLDERLCELKRMWLLPAYHGRGIGYRLAQQLFEFARAQGYTTIRLETGPEQTRAIRFYERLGFHRIPTVEGDEEDVFMEMAL
jgi:putative acetyltransferase